MEPNTNQPPQTTQPADTQPNKTGKAKTFFTPFKVLVVFLILLGVVTVVGELSKSSNPVKKQVAALPEDQEENRAFDATVSIEPTSFSPTVLTVYAYTKVSFENVGTVSDLASVPAGSNYGPSREIVVNPTSPGADKGFKTSGIIPAPQSYDYIFDVPGTYTYHDADTPSINGTIVVLADPPGFKIQPNDGD